MRNEKYQVLTIPVGDCRDLRDAAEVLREAVNLHDRHGYDLFDILFRPRWNGTEYVSGLIGDWVILLRRRIEHVQKPTPMKSEKRARIDE